MSKPLTPAEYNAKTSQLLGHFCQALGPGSFGWCGAGYDENDLPQMAYFLFETPRGVGLLLLDEGYFIRLATEELESLRESLATQVHWELSTHKLFSYFQSEEFRAQISDPTGQEQLNLVCEVAKRLASPRLDASLRPESLLDPPAAGLLA